LKTVNREDSRQLSVLFLISHVQEKVEKWSEELDNLATIAMTQPHAAHAAFTHGLSSYLTRTTRDIGPLLQPLESVTTYWSTTP